ncbi:hypothetical protein ZIOFF_073184 [Zingiber officinale]|uniref:Protein kinase domain-containing protein n=1 Tax=Zingiber officinale TaxID=94328 RepID=A0A8J5EP37_ZINOF|nr:hypothetical protein ZIOFF_073184 [Zingiber officinale]
MLYCAFPSAQHLLIKREVATMKLIKHPNVVRIYELSSSDMVMGSKSKIFIILEFATRGELFNKIPENLLLDAYGNLKVLDFGLSALSQQVRDDGLLHTTCGTPNYVAPEVLNDRGYDGATADLWSCGVILFVLLAGTDSSTHSPTNRIGQVSHSVVLGIVNISDQREVMGLLLDIRRVFSSEVVGVVLLSLGAGILSPAGANNTPLVSYIIRRCF